MSGRRKKTRRDAGGALAATLMIMATLALCGSALGAARLTLLGVEPNFMCLSCHEPLNTVDSPQAVAEKHTLARLINRGDDMAQIKAQMVSIYGQQVLAKPPASGVNLLIYILPPALLLSGLGLLAYSLPRWRARARAAAETPVAGAAPLSGEESARLDDELTKFI
jgi:cytochrome c-type biogenesis protein CcmH